MADYDAALKIDGSFALAYATSTEGLSRDVVLAAVMIAAALEAL